MVSDIHYQLWKGGHESWFINVGYKAVRGHKHPISRGSRENRERLRGIMDRKCVVSVTGVGADMQGEIARHLKRYCGAVSRQGTDLHVSLQAGQTAVVIADELGEVFGQIFAVNKDGVVTV